MARDNKTMTQLLMYADKSVFNRSEWKPSGEPCPLKDLWEEQNPGLYDEIDGDEAEVIETTFTDGQTALRAVIPFKNGSSLELKLGKGDYAAGDIISIPSITAQLLTKVGSEPIVRYNGEVL